MSWMAAAEGADFFSSKDFLKSVGDRKSALDEAAGDGLVPEVDKLLPEYGGSGPPPQPTEGGASPWGKVIKGASDFRGGDSSFKSIVGNVQDGNIFAAAGGLNKRNPYSRFSSKRG